MILHEYRIGKYPITNAQFEEFVRDKRRPVAPVMGWDGQKVPPGLENHPVSGVTWYEALAYCQWLSEKTGRSYSLPNEALWEKACRGGNTFLYPWGNELDSSRSNSGCAALAGVDAYPAQNEFGCFDMVGNVRQWTVTLWGEKLIAPDPAFAYPWKQDRRNDLNANRQIRRVIRGSSFQEDAKRLRCSARSGQFPEDAGLLAMRRAVEGLTTNPDFVLVDARRIPHCQTPQRGIIKGDALSASIAAASIIAKTTRDAIMTEFDSLHPGYNFKTHKGYPTPEHCRCLKELGATPIHRRSFARVRQALGLDPIQDSLFEEKAEAATV